MEYSKIDKLIIYPNLRLIFIEMRDKGHALVAACVGYSKPSGVDILARSGCAQITDKVVAFIAVLMVYLIWAPSIVILKYNSMKFIKAAFYSYPVISAACIQASGIITNSYGVGVFRPLLICKRHGLVGVRV
jgi:hypothetical protein